MNTQLSFDIAGSANNHTYEIELFSAEKWSRNTESYLLWMIPELFSVISSEIQSLKIKISVETNDPWHVNSLICKKQNNGFTINDFKLTNREREVLTLIMNGYTNKEIADILFINFETVRSHRKNILQRTGCKNTAALVNHYHQHC